MGHDSSNSNIALMMMMMIPSTLACPWMKVENNPILFHSWKSFPNQEYHSSYSPNMYIRYKRNIHLKLVNKLPQIYVTFSQIYLPSPPWLGYLSCQIIWLDSSLCTIYRLSKHDPAFNKSCDSSQITSTWRCYYII